MMNNYDEDLMKNYCCCPPPSFDSNTIDFKHFKLLSNTTFGLMTKDKLIDYILMLYHNWQVTDESYYNVMKYAISLLEEIDFLTENPPLKFEELEEGMVIWDKLNDRWLKVTKTYKSTVGPYIECYMFGNELRVRVPFKEGRFYYRKEATE